MRKIFIFTLIAIVLMAAPAFADGVGPFAEFCLGESPLNGEVVPADNPCAAEGAFIVEFNTGTRVYSTWDDMIAAMNEPGSDVEQVWFVVGMATVGDPQDPIAGDPSIWTENACAGDAAIIYQGRDEEGDAVSLSAADDWGCDEESALLVIEPWDGTTMNPDSACFVEDWTALQAFVTRTGWENGSVWVVEADLIDHQMVVNCSSVTGRSNLGLNPNENQIDPRRQTWVNNRAAQLARISGTTLTAYCADDVYADEPLTDLICVSG